MWKRSKHESTDSYFCLGIQLAKCMMRINYHIGPVRTQITNTQNINTQNIPNLHVLYLVKGEPKSINSDVTLSHLCSKDDKKSEICIANVYSTDYNESKRSHISVNTSVVKDSMNETNYEEPSITDNSFINSPSYFKLFECSKSLLSNLDACNI